MKESKENLKRLKKEHRAIRGAYTIKVPNDVNPEALIASIDELLWEKFGENVEDHFARIVWKEGT